MIDKKKKRKEVFEKIMGGISYPLWSEKVAREGIRGDRYDRERMAILRKRKNRLSNIEAGYYKQF